MKARNIVIGQKVDPIKVQRAKELRRRMTPEEKALWEALRTNRLEGFHFRRQQIIDGFIVDFYCHEVGLIIEIDGGVHKMQAQSDKERDQILAARGLAVLRVTNDEIKRDLNHVLERIKSACYRLPLPVSGRGRGRGHNVPCCSGKDHQHQ